MITGFEAQYFGLIVVINVGIIFFSVKRYFIRAFSLIPIKVLFKSVAWAYLCLIILVLLLV